MTNEADNLATVARCFLDVNHQPRTPLAIAQAVSKARKFLFPYETGKFSRDSDFERIEALENAAFDIIRRHFPTTDNKRPRLLGDDE